MIGVHPAEPARYGLRPLSRRAVPRSRARRISACGRNDAGVPVCRCRMRCASAPGPADSKLCVERARGGRGECEPAPLAAWCRGALPTARRLSRAAGYPFLCVGGGALGAHSVRGVCVRVPLARCCWMQRFPVVVCWAARRSVFGLLKRKAKSKERCVTLTVKAWVLRRDPKVVDRCPIRVCVRGLSSA